MTKRDKHMGLPGIQERRANGAVRRQPRKKRKGSWGVLHVPKRSLFFHIGRCWVQWYATERARDQALDALGRKTYYGISSYIYEPVER